MAVLTIKSNAIKNLLLIDPRHFTKVVSNISKKFPIVVVVVVVFFSFSFLFLGGILHYIKTMSS